MEGTIKEGMDSITDLAYLVSIQDPFLRSVADQAVPPESNTSLTSLKPALTRLEDLEIALRQHLIQLLQNQQQNSDTDEEAVRVIGSFWKSALDLCHHLVYHSSKKNVRGSRYEDMNARRLPIQLISDCLDGLPSLNASQIFWRDFVENSLDRVIFGELFWNDEKAVCHLPFLKVCNQFLKSLELSSENTVEWKGRILWHLSKGFSVADKSSTKQWGSFHTNNTTVYENKTEFDNQNSNKLQLSKDQTPSSASPVEYSLYEAFWSLQKDFSNPNHIKLADFINKLGIVLTALESSANNQSGIPASLPQDVAASADLSKKYLTSSVLLPSQMADPLFRSNVVTQFLIVASHLSTESPPLKNALSPFQARAQKLLQKDSPDLYEVLWDGILSGGRENQWRQWKKQRCPAKVFTPQYKHANVNEVGGPKRKVPRLQDGSPVGGNELNEDSDDDNYEFLTIDDIKKASKENREKIPTLVQHLEPYVEALDPESGIEDEYHPKNDSMFTWRAMRLYARHQLPLLRNCRRPQDLERITRLWYKNKGQEIPGQIPDESKLIDSPQKEYGDNKKADETNDVNMTAEDDDDDDDEDLFSPENSSMQDVEDVIDEAVIALKDGGSQRSRSQSQSVSEDKVVGDNADAALDVNFQEDQNRTANTVDDKPGEIAIDVDDALLRERKEPEMCMRRDNEYLMSSEEKEQNEVKNEGPEKVASLDSKFEGHEDEPSKPTSIEASSHRPPNNLQGVNIKAVPPLAAARSGGAGRDDKSMAQQRGDRRSNEGVDRIRDTGPPPALINRDNEHLQGYRGRGGGRSGWQSRGGGRHDEEYRGARGSRRIDGRISEGGPVGPPRDEPQDGGRGGRDEGRGNESRPFRGGVGGRGGSGRRDRRRS